MGLLDSKRLLITGVLTDASLAFAVAKMAQEEGAEVVLSGAGRALSLTQRTARKLPDPPEVLEIDVTVPEQLSAAGEALAARSASRDPTVTRMPASASRTATPRPAGPVPPRIPTCMALSFA